MKKLLGKPTKMKLRRLYVGVTRPSLASWQRPSALLEPEVATCQYCGIKALNDPEYSVPLYYTWQMNKKGAKSVACALCTQVLNINTVGEDNGVFLVLSEINQNDLIKSAYAAYSVTALSYTPPEPPEDPDEVAPEDPIGLLKNHASSFLSTVLGVGGRNLKHLKVTNSPQQELGVVAKALEMSDDYPNAIKNSRALFRYMPRFNENNKKLVVYFYHNALSKTLPNIERWMEFSQKITERKLKEGQGA